MVSKYTLLKKPRFGITGLHNCSLFCDIPYAVLDKIPKKYLVRLIINANRETDLLARQAESGELPAIWSPTYQDRKKQMRKDKKLKKCGLSSSKVSCNYCDDNGVCTREWRCRYRA